MQKGSSLSNTVGSVLDPVISLRRTFQVAAGVSITVDLVTGLGPNRHAALALAEKYRSPQSIAGSQELAQSQLAPPELEDADVDIYGQLASALIYPSSTFRTPPEVIAQNKLGPNALWRHGISGDLPIALLRILGDRVSSPNFELIKQLIQAHAYWRKQGLAADLIILIEQTSDTNQELNDRIESLLATRQRTETLEKPGGIFVRHLGQLSPEEHVLFQSVARVVLTDQGGTLKEQLQARTEDELPTGRDELPTAQGLRRGQAQNASQPIDEGAPKRSDGGLPIRSREEASESNPDEPELIPTGTLLFNNGAGGFTADGREYVITLEPGVTTPVPWVNVLANPNFGTVVSETGGAYTWAENSHELRLTPWNNDPVTDLSGEAFYLRDEETGQIWSPTPLPARGNHRYVVRHGFGYSVFEHSEYGISSQLTIYVAIDATVKFASLKLRNISRRSRRISATGYWEWVFSDLRQRTALHIQTEIDTDSGALLARNFYNNAFTDWIAFIDADGSARTFTGDRNEFLGRNGSLAQPAALGRDRLSGKVGAGLDPCGAVQTTTELTPGSEQEICFRLGAGKSLTEVQQSVRRFREPKANQNALVAVQQYWTRTLSTVHVETPDPSVDVIANGWLLYQVLVCRVWGRTGFYQSGGAFGFRDQLQDVMALVHAEPRLTREHLLRAAARQFREGDVQHWWHPPTGQGVRTHTSDDYLWLPYVTWQYVTRTGDTSVLDEKVSFIEGQLLKPEEADVYFRPEQSQESASLYEHCVRSIEHGLRFGQHGLPLMGTCDWNDGMNLVGKDGRGESVWLAFFLYDVLQRFGKLARGRNDVAFADRCLAQAKEIQSNIEKHAWDGKWYRRAYFDTGEPLGSHLNDECQIDCLPQSWSVISGAGNPERARQAMESLNERLVRRDAKLIQLLDPPFDRSKPSPGYIQGYVPGVRENGGQYTHAAIWTVLAAALEGNDELAWELFSLLNPVNHGRTAADIAKYKVEPYVIAADVYWVPPHTGRGGWTWYTGSAGWIYRTLIETLLGLQPEGNQLRLLPRLPKAWTGYKIHYRYGDTPYHISIVRSPDAKTYLDGKEVSGETVPLVDDKQEHQIEVRVGR
ncbi:MAG: hypothetical protein JOZ31_22175 [Verrucomicrobia bacterium]|nr:hypothetical protein [Verrucomicrobiota bacterium]MBV8485710.1 hypothetical protein [Verrucomicrobiota bacterium]